MFPGKRSVVLLVLSLLPSTHLAGQVSGPKSSIEPPIVQSSDLKTPSEPIVTTAELQIPKAAALRGIMNGFYSPRRSKVQTLASIPFRRPLSAMMMFTGTDNFVAKFVDNSGTLGNSDIFDNSGSVGIGTTNPQATLHVAGNNSPGLLVEAQESIVFGTTACCGAGPTGSSIGSSAGFNSNYNGAFFNSNGTATGGSTGAQINTTVPSWRMALGSGAQEWPGGDNFVIARVAAGGNYGSPSILFSIANNGKIKVAGGVDNTGTGVKHVRVQGCTIAANSPSCSVTVQWPTAFADSNYTPVCMSQGPPVFLSTKTASAITVVLSLGNGFVATVNEPTGELDCIAMHD